jgi:hypothetical protein
VESANDDFMNFLKMYGNLSKTVAYTKEGTFYP